MTRDHDRVRELRRRPVGAAVVVVLTALASCSGSNPSAATLPRAQLVIQRPAGPVEVNVELATTDATRQTGLMGRSTLAPASGMAFLYARPTEQPFWMKDTRIPLSIAFWDAAGRIVAMLDMVPCRTDPCRLYHPGERYVGAVEVNRGFFAMHGVGIGDHVAIRR
jgi:uncharacterized membrane protein (UPF0127 family)